MSLFSAFGVTRPNFLVLTPICVSLGVASVIWAGKPIDWFALGVVLLGAFMAHVSVNALNEYVDFSSGLDFRTQRTPFSGGSGTLVKHPELAPTALAIGWMAFGLTLVCGLILVWRSGLGLIPLGLLGLLVIYLYSGVLNRNRYLVLIAPGLGFGPLMVVGTHYALTGEFSAIAFVVSLIPFFLVNNLLFLNQIPDIEADRSVGRDNFAIALSPSKSAMVYGVFAFLAYLTILAASLIGLLPATALLGLLTIHLTYQVYSGAREHNGDIAQLIPWLGKNVVIVLLTPLLLSIGIGIGAI